MFEVSSGFEQEFVEWWKQCTEVLRKEPGFIDAQLHRSVHSENRFAFINVAHWETSESLESACSKNHDVLHALSVGKGYPALYRVELSYDAKNSFRSEE
jgi:heme-degrading monooxygenase HmoA